MNAIYASWLPRSCPWAEKDIDEQKERERHTNEQTSGRTMALTPRFDSMIPWLIQPMRIDAVTDRRTDKQPETDRRTDKVRRLADAR